MINIQCRKNIRAEIRQQKIMNTNILRYIVCDKTDSKSKNSILCYGCSCCSKRLLCDIHCLAISICDSVSHLLTVQPCKGNVPQNYKELIKAAVIKLTPK